jgi:hypothetical protein
LLDLDGKLPFNRVDLLMVLAHLTFILRLRCL